MKLEFLKKPMEYLRPVLYEVRQVEETAEAIIPDSCPDVESVLSVSGLAFLRGKDLSEGMLTVSVGVSATAIAQPEGRQMPEPVEVYIPMSLKIESGVLHSGQECRVEVHLRRLDGHLVNPRKVMVRASVSVGVWVYAQEREEHLTDCCVGGVQVLKKTAAVRHLRLMGEKNYTVEDQVAMTPEGCGKTICGCQITLKTGDTRLVGSRAVLKGTAEVFVLYLDENEKLKTGSAQVPYSQYVDVGVSEDGDELRLISQLSGADVSFASDGTSLLVVLQIHTAAEVWGTEEIGYIADMYSLKGMVTPEIEDRCYDSLVDRQSFGPVAHAMSDGIMGTPVYVQCIPGLVTQERTGEQVTFTQPVTVQMLCETGDGSLQGAVLRTELKAATTASRDCRFEAALEEVTATTNSGGNLDVKLSGIMSVLTYCPMAFTEILGGELEEQEIKKNGPGLIIRRPRAGESMWDIAKAHCTTSEAIALANGIEGQAVPDKMLLIPGGR